jgi:hypothetical protein
MSVFKVKLNNLSQGLLDLDPSSHPLAAGTGSSPALFGMMGEPFGGDFPNSGDHSLQRQIFVTGPNLTYRLLKDGDVFTDCNYWKQFAYPQMDLEFAFIEVVTDDGSVYSRIPEENTFAVGDTLTLSDSFTLANTVDFVIDHGGPARFLMVQNLDDAISITGELNGDTNVTFVLAAGETQVFNMNDLAITQLRLKSASGTPQASYIASVRSVCYS